MRPKHPGSGPARGGRARSAAQILGLTCLGAAVGVLAACSGSGGSTPLGVTSSPSSTSPSTTQSSTRSTTQSTAPSTSSRTSGSTDPSSISLPTGPGQPAKFCHQYLVVDAKILDHAPPGRAGLRVSNRLYRQLLPIAPPSLRPPIALQIESAEALLDGTDGPDIKKVVAGQKAIFDWTTANCS